MSIEANAADIWRDAWGIPHIRARTRDQAFAALGFAHARDRLWQMEALLRRGTGHYAEWRGSGIRTGIFSREDEPGVAEVDYVAAAGSDVAGNTHAGGLPDFEGDL